MAYIEERERRATIPESVIRSARHTAESYDETAYIVKRRATPYTASQSDFSVTVAPCAIGVCRCATVAPDGTVCVRAGYVREERKGE